MVVAQTLLVLPLMTALARQTLEDATAIRRQLLLSFEKAERESDPDRRRALLTFVIIGGGATGVGQSRGRRRAARSRH